MSNKSKATLAQMSNTSSIDDNITGRADYPSAKITDPTDSVSGAHNKAKAPLEKKEDIDPNTKKLTKYTTEEMQERQDRQAHEGVNAALL